ERGATAQGEAGCLERGPRSLGADGVRGPAAAVEATAEIEELAEPSRERGDAVGAVLQRREQHAVRLDVSLQEERAADRGHEDRGRVAEDEMRERERHRADRDEPERAGE